VLVHVKVGACTKLRQAQETLESFVALRMDIA